MKLITIKSIQDAQKLKHPNGLDDIDIEFGRFILDKSDSNDMILFITAVIASYSIRRNHICANLTKIADQKFPDYSLEQYVTNQELYQIQLPSLQIWTEVIKKYTKIINNGTERTPLVIDEKNRVYLHKYWKYEQELADFLLKKAKSNQQIVDFSNNLNIASISKYFQNDSSYIDWQQVAVFSSIINRLTIITGAPGTGKTSVVASILALIYLENEHESIGICAPTGKAAARLKESIDNEVENLNCDDVIKGKIKSVKTSTIHSLLGVKYRTPFFKHNRENPLNIKTLIVDEVSMVSLHIMIKLFNALKEDTRVILLGDKDQLASVEEGAILGNICESWGINKYSDKFIALFQKYCKDKKSLPKNIDSKMSNTIIELQESYRFDNEKGIGKLKNAVLNNTISGDFFNSVKDSDEIKIIDSGNAGDFEKNLIKNVSKICIKTDTGSKNFIDYLKAKNISDAWLQFNEFQILCSHRKGVFGVENINRLLKDKFLGKEQYPKGLPILITQNDSFMKLYNGDIGLVWGNSNSGIRVYFPDLENRKKFRSYTIGQLPKHETVFAMTVHKSQGSGFQKILLILPNKDSNLLTRELIYTGVTRAKEYCEIWCDIKVLKKAVSRKIERDSGLLDRLVSKL